MHGAFGASPARKTSQEDGFVKYFKTMVAAAGMTILMTGAALAGSKVVATINGAEITEQDLDFARAEIGEQLANIPEATRRRDLLLYLIENQLLAEASEKEKLDKGPGSEELMKYYRRRALHDAYYQQKIRDAVTDEAAKKIYDKEVVKIKPREETRARHILVKSEEDALEIIERLGRGSDFAELAQEKSTGPSGAQGGDLGYFPKGQMVPEFDKALAKMKNGEVSEPVKTQFGWHVIKLEDKRMSKAPDFKDVKERLKSGMIREKAAQVLLGLRQEAKIDILDADVKKAIEEARQRGSFAQ
jgi:peptidyl-prolyl cis-trans isomerase C